MVSQWRLLRTTLVAMSLRVACAELGAGFRLSCVCNGCGWWVSLIGLEELVITASLPHYATETRVNSCNLLPLSPPFPLRDLHCQSNPVFFLSFFLSFSVSLPSLPLSLNTKVLSTRSLFDSSLQNFLWLLWEVLSSSPLGQNLQIYTDQVILHKDLNNWAQWVPAKMQFKIATMSHPKFSRFRHWQSLIWRQIVRKFCTGMMGWGNINQGKKGDCWWVHQKRDPSPESGGEESNKDKEGKCECKKKKKRGAKKKKKKKQRNKAWSSKKKKKKDPWEYGWSNWRCSYLYMANVGQRPAKDNLPFCKNAWLDRWHWHCIALKESKLSSRNVHFTLRLLI